MTDEVDQFLRHWQRAFDCLVIWENFHWQLVLQTYPGLSWRHPRFGGREGYSSSPGRWKHSKFGEGGYPPKSSIPRVAADRDLSRWLWAVNIVDIYLEKEKIWIIQDFKNLTEMCSELTDLLFVEWLLLVGDRMVAWITVEGLLFFVNEPWC